MTALKQKTLVVTGATGFLGSHIVTKLVELGYKVIALVRTQSQMHRLSHLQNKIHFWTLHQSQIDRDLERLFSEFSSINGVIHCATNYGRNNESLDDLIATNILTPLKILRYCIDASIPNFINTDTVLPHSLNHYSFSKHQFKEWGRYLSQNSNTKFINLRFEHFYGADDDASKFTSYIVQACLANHTKIKLTAGEQQRDFVYIKDSVSAFITILEQVHKIPIGFSEYDVGTGKIISVRDFAKIVKNLTCSRSILDFGALPYRLNEMMRSETNLIPLNSLGWYSQYTLEQGLSEMIALQTSGTFNFCY